MTCRHCEAGVARQIIRDEYFHVLSLGGIELCEQQGDIAPDRVGDWCQTFTGGQFWPLDPRPSEIFIIDIAGALAKDCRYGGHCLRMYSVAEHSVVMTREARRLGYPLRDLRTTLLHDASEGLCIRDIPRPIKDDLTNYRAIEHRIMLAVAARYDIDWPVPPHIKALDESIGLTEEATNMSPKPAQWRTQRHQFKATTPLAVTLPCWPFEQAFAEFLIECAACGVRA